MAMSSITCDHGWTTRTHNNEMDVILTAQGELKQHIDALVSDTDETHRCFQTYVYGGDDITKYIMIDVKKKAKNSKTMETYYERIFKSFILHLWKQTTSTSKVS